MLAAALRAEVAAYIEQFADELDEKASAGGAQRLATSAEVITAAGAVTVTAPRVNDKRVDPETGERQRFSSAILPAWARKSPQVGRGVAAAVPARAVHRGFRCRRWSSSSASGAGLSAATITRLTAQWQDEAQAFAERDLSGVDYVYLWVDGIHLKVRLEQDKLCLLVMIGVRADGRKELVALTDGYRESTESWADLLRDCRRRGMRAPVLAVGDGALGFWRRAARGVPGDPRAAVLVPQDQRMFLPRCRSRRTRGRRRRSRRSGTPRTTTTRQDAVKAFEVDYGAKFPKAVAKITDDARRAAGVLRLPGRALDPSENYQSDRVDLRHRAATGARSPRAPAPAPPESPWPTS